MDGNSEQLQVISLKQLPIIEERLRDVKAKIEQRTSAVMALAVTEETRTDVKKIRTEVRKELEGYEAQRMAVKKAIMTPYEQFEAVYKECVSNPYKAADEALGKKIADVEAGIKQQKEDDVRAFFTELTSGFGLDWLKFEQMNLKVTLTCTPKAMKAAITQSVTKIVRDCAALEENPDRDEIMVEYQKSLDLGSACQIVQQRHKQLEAQRRAAEERRARQQAQQEAEAKAKAAIEAEAAKRAAEQPAPPHEVATPPQAESPAQAQAAAPAPVAAPAEKKYLAKFAVTGTLPQLKALKAFMEKEGMVYLCRPCNAYVGVHIGTDRPKGSLANAELRGWRKAAHASFDPLWQDGPFKKRNAAYRWLSEQMKLPIEQTHIGMFTVEQCKAALEIINKGVTV